MGTGIDIRIETDTEAYEKFMKQFPIQSAKAMGKALNKIGKSAESAMIKEVRAIYNITASRLRQRLFISRASARELLFELTISRKKNQPNITSFGAKQTKKAVTVAIVKGKRQKFPGAFITKFAKTGGTAAFQRDEITRVPTKGRYKGKISSRGPSKGKPIERHGLFALYGPQIIEMFKNPRVQAVFQKKVAERAPIVIAQEMKFLADKLARQFAGKAA